MPYETLLRAKFQIDLRRPMDIIIMDIIIPGRTASANQLALHGDGGLHAF